MDNLGFGTVCTGGEGVEEHTWRMPALAVCCLQWQE